MNVTINNVWKYSITLSTSSLSSLKDSAPQGEKYETTFVAFFVNEEMK
jgi:hypothetical protein